MAFVGELIPVLPFPDSLWCNIVLLGKIHLLTITISARSFGVVRACGWITMALCFLQVLREPVVQYLAGSEQRIAPFWNIITWYPTLDLSYFIQDYWWAILIGLAATVVVVSNLWKRSPKFRELIDRGMLKAPIFGSIMHKSALARFARTTSTMFAAGVPMVEALDSVAGATGSIVYGNAVKEMREDIATGQSLRLAMEQQPLFPHMVKQMVAIGEESGSLDDMLSKVADFYEEEVDNAVDAISSLMEPLIMVALGTLVAGLVVAMYLPIFKLGAAI